MHYSSVTDDIFLKCTNSTTTSIYTTLSKWTNVTHPHNRIRGGQSVQMQFAVQSFATRLVQCGASATVLGWPVSHASVRCINMIRSVYSYDVTPGDGTTSLVPAQQYKHITMLLVADGSQYSLQLYIWKLGFYLKNVQYANGTEKLIPLSLLTMPNDADRSHQQL